MRRIFLPTALVLLTLLALDVSPIFAQRFGRDAGAGDRILRWLDRNRNGTIDPEESARMPEPMREFLRERNVDLSRPISGDTLDRLASEMFSAMRDRRSRGRDSDDRNSRRGGDFGSRGRGDSSWRFGGSDRFRSGDRDDRDSRSRRERYVRRDRPDRDSREADNRARPRVTVALPEKYLNRDRNGDGQIGLYEWERSALAEFQRLDQNGDGFLSPRELANPPQTPVAVQDTASEQSITDSEALELALEAAASPNSTNVSRSGRSRRPSRSAPADSSPSEASSAPRNSPASRSDNDDSAAEEDPDARAARSVFRLLDVNRDGTLTEDEWNRSRRTRTQFERAGVSLSLPLSAEQFIPKYRETRSSGGN